VLEGIPGARGQRLNPDAYNRFSSELKSVVDQDCDNFMEFPDGHYWTPSTGIQQWYKPEWDSDDYQGSGDTDVHSVRKVLEEAVRSQCMSDGGLALIRPS
jgi:asparagine synthase (glutamine-hydrolysing)